MKKTLVILFLAFFAVTATNLAQQKKSMVEVLYFKANLACCKARACNTLEAKVKEIIDKNWTDGSVTFREVKLSDTLNNDLINKYHAQSQTLIIVIKTKDKETSADASSILQEFAKTNDASAFEMNFIGKVNLCISEFL
ncbi:MAG: hypothetical protein HQ542_06555 [Bacteroidia bacterium]|nr:hypothetical protein [Bacteroidia bacterium]